MKKREEEWDIEDDKEGEGREEGEKRTIEMEEMKKEVIFHSPTPTHAPLYPSVASSGIRSLDEIAVPLPGEMGGGRRRKERRGRGG